ncbi:putative flavoprotein involved in K+ transport [Amycolatopsis marina]|uniref:Putative flavoprotein involved in K+ transport n=1 Tax=Amycolatopsis marina TaxID=490629 RepID=A0A1I1C0H7_9PSEU|nr:NAD(P)-binding domain-containing protein [Amycolatopsis marina]SFB56134.1 putative flavoprotein involved in K+ transport [Amycolatopsis marina]
MEPLDVIVIGGGQAGLGMGYRLRQAGLSFTIVDERPRTGDVWRDRWDSLRLFTPRPFVNLPGLKAPGDMQYYPTKDEIADYLQRYREQFDLPVRNGFRVQSLQSRNGVFAATGDDETLEAKAVVIAAGPFHTPHVPACAHQLDSAVRQLHSQDYRRPDDLGPGNVLVVGGGNSATQIAEELSAGRRVTIATNGQIAYAPKTIAGVSLFWFMHLTGMLRADKDAWVSRYARPHSDTVIGFNLRKLIDQHVVRHIPHRVTDCDGREVAFADGTREGFDNVLWCTGFRPGYEWLKVVNALDEAGSPQQTRGISPVPGLYWLGHPWQNRLNSALLNGVDMETRQLMRHIG